MLLVGDYAGVPLVAVSQVDRGRVLLNDEEAFWRHLIVSVFGRRFEQDVQQIVDRYARE